MVTLTDDPVVDATFYIIMRSLHANLKACRITSYLSSIKPPVKELANAEEEYLHFTRNIDRAKHYCTALTKMCADTIAYPKSRPVNMSAEAYREEYACLKRCHSACLYIKTCGINWESLTMVYYLLYDIPYEVALRRLRKAAGLMKTQVVSGYVKSNGTEVESYERVLVTA